MANKKNQIKDLDLYIDGELVPVVPGSFKAYPRTSEIQQLETKIELAEKADIKIALHILTGTVFLVLLFGSVALLLLFAYNIHRIRLRLLEDRLAKLKEAG